MQSSFFFFQGPQKELDTGKNQRLQPQIYTRGRRKKEQSHTLRSCHRHFSTHTTYNVPFCSQPLGLTHSGHRGKAGVGLHLLAVGSDEVQLLEGFWVRRKTQTRDLKHTIPSRILVDVFLFLGCRGLSLPSYPFTRVYLSIFSYWYQYQLFPG